MAVALLANVTGWASLTVFAGWRGLAAGVVLTFLYVKVVAWRHARR